MSSKIRIGVVGVSMGRNHARSYAKHPDAELVALCDTNTERLAEVAAELSVPQTYTSYDEMLEKAGLDAVSIAVPNVFHEPFTIQAVKAGCQVLCEKPMAMTVTGAQKMRAAAEDAGKSLMINFSYRFSKMSQALKRQVESGVLGNVYFARSVWHRRYGMPRFGGWFGQKEMSGGGPLIDLGVHRLDLALWLMEYPEPLTVTGSTWDHLGQERAARENQQFDVEDLASGFIRFDNGASLVLEAGWAGHIQEKELMETRLFGTKGGMVQRNVAGTYAMEAQIYTRDGDNFYTRTLDDTLEEPPNSYEVFINSLVEGRKPPGTPEEGVKVMKILAGLYESARLGREIRYDT